MSSLVRARTDRVDNHVSAFFAGEVRALRGVLEAVDSGLVRELYRLDRAIRGLYGNCLRAGIDFVDRAGKHVSRILGRKRNCDKAHREGQDNLKTCSRASG